ncbi:hypothetical protein H4F99_03320 [Lysobacter sp. SG-8]|uniref:Sel1 repeat family protein n=1 Tax=Marilutibacter penaei TaxID=2759900 RepID=A0A7W3U2P1_9GAMM|nr:hypothetical protein [Lysobacter penaei]MBB1087515.1 hypothetical protein [Lysobacter penaei]
MDGAAAGQQADSPSPGEVTIQVTLPPSAGRILADAEHCDGVLPAPPGEVAKLWRMAAQSGHVPSMRNYALGNGLNGANMLGEAEAMIAYRGEAPEFARRAAAEGDLVALLALAAAYSPRSHEHFPTLLAPAAGQDVEASMALYLHAQNVIAPVASQPEWTNVSALIQRRLGELRVMATSGEISMAEREAQEMWRRWKRPVLDEPPPVTLLGRGGARPIKASACMEG